MEIVHRIGVKAPAAQVYAALATIDGLAGWWTRATTGSTQPGGHVAFRFHTAAGDDIGGFNMEVLDQTHERKVRWRVKDGPAEWIDTEVQFDLSQQDGHTIVMFRHGNWRDAGPGGEFMAHCSTKWATFLLSLRDLVETGAGRPAPDDVKISNWH